jgi:hypothetical protein
MKVKINKTTADYTAIDCSIVSGECAGTWCLKQNHPKLSACAKCQCFYCTKGDCIKLNK